MRREFSHSECVDDLILEWTLWEMQGFSGEEVASASHAYPMTGKEIGHVLAWF